MGKNFILLILGLCIPTLQGADTKSQRGLIMLFDDTELKFDGAVSHAFTNALDERAIPIIVSGSLFNAFLEKNSTSEIFIFDKHNNNHKLSFIPSEWRILYLALTNNLYKHLSDPQYFYLLIPNNYIKNQLPEYNLNAITQETWSLVLKKLGFNDEKLNTVNALNLNDLHNVVRNSISQNTVGYNGLIDITQMEKFLTSLFHKRTPDIFLEWTFYILGHGAVNYSVAGIPIFAFPSMLNFFAERLNTKLIVYTTCFGGGTNIETVFNDFKTASGPTARVYPFAIVINGLGDFLVFEKVNASYNTFFKRSFNAEVPINYPYVVEPVANIMNGGNIKYLQSAAQIRLPGLAWFSLIEGQNKIVSLTRTLMATCDPNKEFSIQKLFDKQKTKNSSSKLPEAILLYTDHIPCPLDVATGFETNAQPPRIISPLSDAKVIKIFHINYSAEPSLKAILQSFTDPFENVYQSSTDAHQVKKTYWIQTIECEKGTILTDVLIHHTELGHLFLFKKNENGTLAHYFLVNKNLDNTNNPTLIDDSKKINYTEILTTAQRIWEEQQTKQRAGPFTLPANELKNVTNKLETLYAQKLKEIQATPPKKQKTQKKRATLPSNLEVPVYTDTADNNIPAPAPVTIIQSTKPTDTTPKRDTPPIIPPQSIAAYQINTDNNTPAKSFSDPVSPEKSTEHSKLVLPAHTPTNIIVPAPVAIIQPTQQNTTGHSAQIKRSSKKGRRRAKRRKKTAR